MSSVSVVIPVRNGEAFLAEAIQSALEQTRSPDEIVVVDDGSTDRSAQIASGFPQARVLRQPPSGVAAARNAGVAASRGELIAFLDADDLWPADKLEIQAGHLEAHPEVGVTLGREQVFLADGAEPPAWAIDLDGRMASPMTAVMRRTAWELVGPMDVSLSLGEDTDWLMRASERGLPVVVLEHLVLHRRLHGANATYDDVRLRRCIAVLLKGRLDRRRARELR